MTTVRPRLRCPLPPRSTAKSRSKTLFRRPYFSLSVLQLFSLFSSMPRVTGLFIYPVKSLRGCAVSAAELDALGFVGDRRFLIVDPTGKFLTQRTVPRMALITAQLTPGTLTLVADGAGNISVSTASDPSTPLRSVTVWKSEGLQAENCGATASAWLSHFLGLTCALVRIGQKFIRPNLKPAACPGDIFTFADACPFLVISEASLATVLARQ